MWTVGRKENREPGVAVVKWCSRLHDDLYKVALSFDYSE